MTPFLSIFIENHQLKIKVIQIGKDVERCVIWSPGSGKVLERRNYQKYGLAHISTGDILRHELRKEQSWERLQQIYQSSELVPDALMVVLK